MYKMLYMPLRAFLFENAVAAFTYNAFCSSALSRQGIAGCCWHRSSQDGFRVRPFPYDRSHRQMVQRNLRAYFRVPQATLGRNPEQCLRIYIYVAVPIQTCVQAHEPIWLRVVSLQKCAGRTTRALRNGQTPSIACRRWRLDWPA